MAHDSDTSHTHLAKKPTSVHVHVTLNEPAAEALATLTARHETNKTTVIRRALRFLAYIEELDADGYQVQAVSRDGKSRKDIVMM